MVMELVSGRRFRVILIVEREARQFNNSEGITIKETKALRNKKCQLAIDYVTKFKYLIKMDRN